MGWQRPYLFQASLPTIQGVQDKFDTFRSFACLLGLKGASTTEVILILFVPFFFQNEEKHFVSVKCIRMPVLLCITERKVKESLEIDTRKLPEYWNRVTAQDVPHRV